MPGSHTCGCKEGFMFDSDGNCVDMNECNLPSGQSCQQMCINNNGSFSCICGPGYNLADDGRRCIGMSFI